MSVPDAESEFGWRHEVHVHLMIAFAIYRVLYDST